MCADHAFAGRTVRRRRRNGNAGALSGTGVSFDLPSTSRPHDFVFFRMKSAIRATPFSMASFDAA